MRLWDEEKWVTSLNCCPHGSSQQAAVPLSHRLWPIFESFNPLPALVTSYDIHGEMIPTMTSQDGQSKFWQFMLLRKSKVLESEGFYFGLAFWKALHQQLKFFGRERAKKRGYFLSVLITIRSFKQSQGLFWFKHSLSASSGDKP